MLEFVNSDAGFIHFISARIPTVLVYLIEAVAQTKVSLTK